MSPGIRYLDHFEKNLMFDRPEKSDLTEIQCVNRDKGPFLGCNVLLLG